MYLFAMVLYTGSDCPAPRQSGVIGRVDDRSVLDFIERQQQRTTIEPIFVDSLVRRYPPILAPRELHLCEHVENVRCCLNASQESPVDSYFWRIQQDRRKDKILPTRRNERGITRFARHFYFVLIPQKTLEMDRAGRDCCARRVGSLVCHDSS